MTAVLLALGLVLVVEGLVLALIPGRFEEIVRALGELPPDVRRALGLGALALGIVLIWLAGGLPI